MAGWLAGSVIILPLRGPSCNLRLARSSARLNFSDGPSVAKRVKKKPKEMKNTPVSGENL